MKKWIKDILDIMYKLGYTYSFVYFFKTWLFVVINYAMLYFLYRLTKFLFT